MIYPDRFEIKVGFDVVRSKVREYCLCNDARERVDTMTFVSNYEEVLLQIEQTAEMCLLLHGGEDLPFQTAKEVRDIIKKASIDGIFLEAKELLYLKHNLVQIRNVVHYIRKQEEGKVVLLKELCKDVQLFNNFISHIDKTIDNYGELNDYASVNLQQIRKELRSEQAGINRKLESILKKAKADGLVDKDVNPSMRDGRLVIPIISSNKRMIPGIVHDESATGKTSYIEPTVVVEANNKVKELEAKERREVIKILMEITAALQPHLANIETSLEFLGHIDFIRAKALFCNLIDAHKPHIVNYSVLNWKKAKHPLLYLTLKKEEREVVPLDINLDEREHILLISGPNAGGKSVCLKTVGLLQYMMQCGLIPPMQGESEMGIFHHLFIDIGDEQSIDNDLSTYSSHLTNMKNFLKYGNQQSLVLIDEFGTGTEPQIGGAIAEAILAQLNSKQVFGVITTHYTNLKHFAEDTQGIINGAMLYDQHLMQPLFQLQVGRPGSSFAIEIARKIGLPESIISQVSEKVGQDTLNFDKYLREIIRDKHYWEKKRDNIRKQNRQLEQQVEQYAQKLQQAEKQEKEIINAAKLEAQKVLKEANSRIENVIRVIRETQADKDKTNELRDNLQDFKTEILLTSNNETSTTKQLEELNRKYQLENKHKNTSDIKKLDKLKAGDKVRLLGQNSVGELLEVKGGKAVVAFGGIKANLKITELESISNKEYKQKIRETDRSTPQLADYNEKRLNFKSNIDVRGQRAEEALQNIIHYIDDAVMVGCKELRILHGTGTGALRQILREYLQQNSVVSSAKDEQVQMGGAGITVVKLNY